MARLRTCNTRARRRPWAPVVWSLPCGVKLRTPEVTAAIGAALLAGRRKTAELNIIRSTARMYGVAPVVERRQDLAAPPLRYPT